MNLVQIVREDAEDQRRAVERRKIQERKSEHTPRFSYIGAANITKPPATKDLSDTC